MEFRSVKIQGWWGPDDMGEKEFNEWWTYMMTYKLVQPSHMKRVPDLSLTITPSERLMRKVTNRMNPN
jgi:hypothetical protein